MYRRAKDFGNRLKRQALAKKFPITADQLAELAREAVASKPATICPPRRTPLNGVEEARSQRWRKDPDRAAIETRASTWRARPIRRGAAPGGRGGG